MTQEDKMGQFRIGRHAAATLAVALTAIAFLIPSAAALAQKASSPTEEAFRKGEEFGAKQNYAEALRWYRIAAENGHLESQNNVGMFYVTGMGVKQDVAQGL